MRNGGVFLACTLFVLAHADEESPCGQPEFNVDDVVELATFLWEIVSGFL
jgi:hypothetical protein